MKKLTKVMLLFSLALLMFSFTACAQIQKKLDVVGQQSIPSFGEVLNAMPEQTAADDINGGWSLTAPDGGASFIWSADWSKSPRYDVMLEFDATPFLAAGLEPQRLPDNYVYSGGLLLVGEKLGDEAASYSGEPTPLAAYGQIVDLKPGAINYHTEMDHYGVMLGNGNMFEWAKDMSTNDKDIVFVLNPEPLIAAGVDPNAVQGWLFAKVPVDVNGKPTEVDKFLKPFDLE